MLWKCSFGQSSKTAYQFDIIFKLLPKDYHLPYELLENPY